VSTLIGQHALVTGASRGIGEATAMALADAGASVSLLVRDRNAGERVMQAIRQRVDVPVAIVVADVTDELAVERACADAVRALGAVTLLVNNAGSATAMPFLRTSTADFQSMFDVHVLGAMRTIRQVVPTMLQRQFGRIVNVASVAGMQGASYVAPYVTAKHALVGLTRALAAEYGARGLTVNAVCPAFTDTDLVRESVQRIVSKTGRTAADALRDMLADAGQLRLVTVHEVAAEIVSFCDPDAAHRNGEALVLDGARAP
jgi:NAD(P)-dependent dehydrogenase (short-subunit alcohol dehydrogenase family)